MTWLLPAGFLALLTLPILIVRRLVGARRRTQPVGALLLWEQAAQGLPQGSGRRLPVWPLLLLELSALAALAFGLARPVWLGEAPALDVLLVVDRTASMAAQGADGTTAWQRGVRALTAALGALPTNSRYTLRTVPAFAGGAVEGPRDAVLAVVRTMAPEPHGVGDPANAVGGSRKPHTTISTTTMKGPLSLALPMKKVSPTVSASLSTNLLSAASCPAENGRPKPKPSFV